VCRRLPPKNLSPPHRPARAAVGIPDVPSYFVPRTRDMTKLRALLEVGDRKASTTVVSAVHGLGGGGKTTPVAQLAGDLAKQGVFADGIYWLTLGEELADADILKKLGSLVDYFGDRQHQPRQIDETSSYLKGILEDKKALIILDDAWEIGHVRPFLV